MTRDVNEHMLQTFQATAIRYVETAHRFRHQREEILKKYIKKPKDEAAPLDSQKDAVSPLIKGCTRLHKKEKG